MLWRQEKMIKLINDLWFKRRDIVSDGYDESRGLEKANGSNVCNRSKEDKLNFLNVREAVSQFKISVKKSTDRAL